MKGILADANIQGYVDFLVARMRAEPWKLFWDDLAVTCKRFSEVSLAPDSPDSQVWETCQRLELILVTDNRNKNTPDSLEATILTRNTATSLPVFTIGDILELRRSREYTTRVIEKFLDSLQRIENLRGTGRLYLP